MAATEEKSVVLKKHNLLYIIKKCLQMEAFYFIMSLKLIYFFTQHPFEIHLRYLDSFSSVPIDFIQNVCPSPVATDS
jgi:hypothetical protein